MPFTLSHPAIILPLAKGSPKWISLTGLVVGSMTPDFEYFIRMGNSVSHTLPGLFYFDLPLALLLTFAFHNIIRNPLYNNLPTAMGVRLLQYQSFQWNEYFKTHGWVVIPSALIGAGSHLFWDGFTHGNGYFVQSIHELTTPVEMFGDSIPIYRIIRLLSTVFGGLIVLLYIFRMPGGQTVNQIRSAQYWPILILLTTVIIAVRSLFGFEINLLGQLAGTGISACLIALIVTPFILRTKYT